MSLIKWSEKFLPGLVPAVDVYDNKDALVIETAIPGVDPKNVHISVEGKILTISGSSERKTEVDEKDYYRKEIRSGSFIRRVTLPAGMKQGEIQSAFKDGILKITFPKLQIDQPKDTH